MVIGNGFFTDTESDALIEMQSRSGCDVKRCVFPTVGNIIYYISKTGDLYGMQKIQGKRLTRTRKVVKNKDIEINVLKAKEASKFSPTDSRAFKIIEELCMQENKNSKNSKNSNNSNSNNSNSNSNNSNSSNYNSNSNSKNSK